jgi:hypothetical protein
VVVFVKFLGTGNFWNYFSKENLIEYVHDAVDRVHGSMGL